MVEELEAEGSCGPFGHMTKGKGRLPDEQERGENMAEADVFRKGNVQGGNVMMYRKESFRNGDIRRRKVDNRERPRETFWERIR